LDAYIMHLMKLMEPTIVRIADLTTRADIAPRVVQSRATPIDALIAPSLYIALHPDIEKQKIPTYVMPGVVDTRVFTQTFASPGDKLNRVVAAVTPQFCGGQATSWMCEQPQYRHTARCTISQPPVVFGFMARLSPEKGLGHFLVAANLTRKHLSHAKFIIVGEVSAQAPLYRDGLLHLIDHYGLTDAVKLVGFVAPEDVPAVYGCMDVFVAPYVRPATETFALTILEAMAMRVPVVHFNVGGIRVRPRPCLSTGRCFGCIGLLCCCCG
jgi:glycosyltransferase involved in cell wall biosynthesis